ncbi:hypothetical protein ACQE3D_18335 [Methylomonas sp. MS20]|uniref:hypothetical protein n=1 Tax=Methylomonas sp. MS20 TaxID=3418769 RepID=UPI003D0159F2
MNEDAKKRQQILEALYRDRKANASRLHQDPWTSLVELTHAVDDIDFALSVLIELKYVERTGNRLRITGAGVLACEAGQDR